MKKYTLLKSSRRITVVICWFFVVAASVSCNKILDLEDPKNEVNPKDLFAYDNNAQLALNGLYGQFAASSGISDNLMNMTGFLSDELLSNTLGQEYQTFANNTLLADNTRATSLWRGFYKSINTANSIIENATSSTGLTASFRSQLIGESKFIRSLCYFYLINLFGDVPLVTVTDIKSTANLPRAASSDVYSFVVGDLQEAQQMVPEGYDFVNGQRIRANKSVIAALLAKVYLYGRDWQKAEELATAVISDPTYNLLPTEKLDGVFLANNEEAIFQLPFRMGNSYDARFFLNSFANRKYFQAYLRPSYLAYFENGDLRKAKWTLSAMYDNVGGKGTFTAPYKYKINQDASSSTELPVLLRLAEQYLIRSEARAEQNKLTEALSDLDVIRKRAGLGNSTAIEKGTILLAIEKERATELFTEFGQRWFDLRRRPGIRENSATRADDVLRVIKPSTWKATAINLPVPAEEISINGNLKQNPGY